LEWMVNLDIMSSKPEISVLVATYNTPFQQLQRAIRSVINQTFQNFEIVLVDDGSTNDPGGRLDAFCEQQANRIRLFRQENNGQSSAINLAVTKSQGYYLSILDADDEYLPQHLQSCREQMAAYDLIASTTQTIVDQPEDYFVLDRHHPDRLIHVDDCILFATLFGKREVFTRRKFIDGYAADADFYDWAKYHYRVGKVDLRTYRYYRNNPESTCEQLKVKLGKKNNSTQIK